MAQAKTKRAATFYCQECGHAFLSLASAERASFGPEGCPECGGADIDEGAPEQRTAVAS